MRCRGDNRLRKLLTPQHWSTAAACTATLLTQNNTTVCFHTQTWQLTGSSPTVEQYLRTTWKVQLTDWVKVLRPTWHRVGHSGDVLPSQSLGLGRKYRRERNFSRGDMTRELLRRGNSRGIADVWRTHKQKRRNWRHWLVAYSAHRARNSRYKNTGIPTDNHRPSDYVSANVSPFL